MTISRTWPWLPATYRGRKVSVTPEAVTLASLAIARYHGPGLGLGSERHDLGWLRTAVKACSGFLLSVFVSAHLFCFCPRWEADGEPALIRHRYILDAGNISNDDIQSFASTPVHLPQTNQTFAAVQTPCRLDDGTFYTSNTSNHSGTTVRLLDPEESAGLPPRSSPSSASFGRTASSRTFSAGSSTGRSLAILIVPGTQDREVSRRAERYGGLATSGSR